MNDYITIGTLQHIFLVLVTATIAVFAWMLETVWRNEKYKALYVLILPIGIVYYIYKYWEEMRFKCFFAVLIAVMIGFISIVTKYNFIERIFALVQLVSIWPYYAVFYFLNKT